MLLEKNHMDLLSGSDLYAGHLQTLSPTLIFFLVPYQYIQLCTPPWSSANTQNEHIWYLAGLDSVVTDKVTK